MILDNITNKFYPFFFVLINNNDKNTYLNIFSFINEYMNKNVENTEYNLKIFCTDFEEGLFSSFKHVFQNENNNIHHIGFYFHYI